MSKEEYEAIVSQDKQNIIDYMNTLYVIQDNITRVGERFDYKDVANGKGLV